ncbi:MAG: GLUG motif-containing protein [Gallionella sp.]|nr:GLUG motif-containing protein [Gallionella sp.]
MRKKNTNEQLHTQPQFHLKPVYAAVLLAFTVQTVQANPTDATVVSGQASFATTGSTLTVTNTPGAIIHWQGFSIGANEITRFAQQSASSAVLNRVVSNNPSSILGTLQSNGRVFLINPNGIVFGQGSTVDVAGLVASTLNLSNADFLAGRYSFTEVPGAQKISNAGNIAAQGDGLDGGQIYLIAPDVENTGVITAPNGEILLAAGHSVDLVNTNSPNLIVNITAPAGDATNVGQLIASSGSLGLFGTVVKNSGAVSADSATMQGGKIVFRSTQRTEAGGTVSASGNGGGEIKMLSDMQTGTVSVTGTLDASAPVSGDGGFVDTSAAHVQVADTARVTTAALNGKYGTWLIDPTDYTISATDPLNGSSWMSGTALGLALDAGNVTIQTLVTGGGAGDILINDNVTKVATGGLTSLTLQAHNNILVSAGNSISSIGFALNVVLTSDSDGAGGGGIYLDTGSSIISNGGNITLGGMPPMGYAIGNGTITGGKTFNSGIYVLGDITAGAGNVTMRGEGRALNSGSNHLADGITFAGGLLSSNGVVSIDGLAHVLSASTAGTDVTAGVDFLGAGTRLSTQTGTVTVTGLNDAGAGFCRAQGITVEAGTIIETIGIGTLTLNGTSTGLDTGWGVGIFGGTVQTTAAGGGAITLNGINVTNPDGGVVIQDGSVLSSGGEIRIIGEGLGGSGTIGTSTIGGASSGDILIKANNSGPINITSASSINAGSNTLTLILAGGPFNDNGSSITAGSLRLLGTGTFNLGGTNNNVGTLAANVTGNVAYKDNNGFIIGSVTSFDGTATTTTTGVTTNNSNFTGTTVGNITLNVGSAINTGTGALNLSATGGNLNINGEVSAGIFTLSGGTWNQISATLPGFTVNDFRITGGTFIRALSGDGTITPYQLADIYGVQGMGSAGMLGNSYELANGINAAGTVNWNAGAGFVPVGNVTTSFTGQFDGLGYTISNLVINRPTTSYVGLFGYAVGSSIMNVGLVNSSVTGSSDVGALAGYSSGTIGSSYVSGAAVLGNSSVGGLVGYNFGSISNSYVSGGSVMGSSKVGGLVGYNGLTATITNSYSTGKVTGSVNVGGLVGTNSGTITDSYWDITTSGQATSAGGTGLTTTQMMTQASYTGFDFTNTWWMIDGNTRPFLRSEWSTNITNAHQLQLAGMDATTLAATYTLKNDIDLAPALAAGGMWSSSGFVPIGNATTNFTGTFDGLGHTISNLTINRPATIDIGLFGVTGAGSAISNVGLDLASVTGYDRVGALVGNANGGITNSYASGNVTGRYWVGGLVGIVNATITDVYSTGTVSGQSSVGGLAGSSGFSTISSSYSASNVNATGVAQSVGGFVGDATWSTISNSYSTGSVVGSSSVGGFAGGMQSGGNGSISNSYSIGAVTGTTNVGGFAGINAGSGAITNSFWDIATSGQATSAGGTGFTLTSAAMIQANYTGWDFTNTWWMSNANTRPFLRSEYSTNITNAHQLQLMAMDATTLGASYTLGANIDAAETALGIGMWSSAGFLPIGDPFAPPYGFSGKLDGQGHTISNLSINSAGGDAGLFGVVGVSGIVGNVGLINSSVVAAGSSVGGLVGNNAGTITNSYVSNGFVNVTGAYSSVGGLVGGNSGTVSNSYVSAGSVHGEYSAVGGLVGANTGAGMIDKSYVSNVSVVNAATWSASVGGLVGNNAGTISNSYVNGGTVASLSSGAVGGLAGYNSGSISTSYASSGSLTSVGVSVGGPVGGLVGSNNGSVSNSFWDSDTTGAAIPVGANSGSVTGVAAVRSSTATVNAYSASAYSGFDFGTTWWMSNTNTRPFLQSEYSTTITNSHQLQLMAMGLGASYTLGANIDMAETGTGVGMWGSSGFLPIGDPFAPPYGFSGKLDGQGHTISDLTINRSATNYVGLFGYLDTGALVSNVGLVGGSVTGSSHVGSLAGYSGGGISNSYASSVIVSGGSTAVGGLVGKNDWGGSISNSYVDNGSVTSAWRWVGGLAGINFGAISNNSHVNNSTVTGGVSGDSVGGLVGWNDGNISNSYVSNGNVTGATSVGGLAGWNTGIISNSYVNNGNVNGTWNVGGLVGNNSDTISDSYASGSVTGNNNVGGLAGVSNGSISNSYVSSGYVWGSSNVGGLLGMNNGSLANSHYNIDVVSIQDGNHVTLGGLYNTQYLDWYGTGIIATGGLVLDIANYSGPGQSLELIGGNYTITGVQGMKDMLGFADNAAYTFSLAANITLTSGLYIPYLTADFDGANFTVSNLNVSQSFNDNLGLFGHIALGSTVSNVALLNAAVTGKSNFGAVAGWNEGSIINSNAFGGTMSGGSSNVGGLVGLNQGSSTGSGSYVGGIISNSYVSNGTVTGIGISSRFGGLVGLSSGGVSNSHVSGGSVTGTSDVGGLVGSNDGGEGGAASISNSFVNNGAMVTGSNGVGGLVGYSSNSTISNSYVSGSTVSGSGDVGGLVGFYSSVLSINSLIDGSSVVNTTVSGGLNVGGLVGQNSVSISNSYVSGGSVTGSGLVGGLAGYSSGSISNSYVNGGSVLATLTSGPTANAGGLVGMNSGGASITNSYASNGSLSGGSAGGVVGANYGSVTNSFWDTTTVGAGVLFGIGYDSGAAGLPSNIGTTVLTTAQMMTQTSFIGFDFTNTWWMSDTNTRPFLRSEWNTNITNAHQLQLMGMDVTALAASYTLANNIDLAPALAAGGMWDSAKGFVPVGDSGTPFAGLFDGQGNTISNLSISGTSYVGLFGMIGAGGNVSNVGLNNVTIAGTLDYVGGLVGWNSGTIYNAYVSGGSVTGFNSEGGGLVGSNRGGAGGNNNSVAGTNASVSNSYVSGVTVSGNANAGGLAGVNYGGSGGTGTLGGTGGTATISNSYVTGGTVTNTGGLGGGLAGSNINGPAGGTGTLPGGLGGAATIDGSYTSSGLVSGIYAGGIAGNNDGTISNSYWNTTTTQQSSAVGNVVGTLTNVVGLTTAEMQQQASFTGWDFTTVWRSYNGHSAPLLKSFLKPVTVTASGISGNFTKTYDGVAWNSPALGTITYSDPLATGLLNESTPFGAPVTNAGSYEMFWSGQQGYDISYTAGGMLTITPAGVTLMSITANDASKTYGSTLNFLGTEFTPVGLVGSDAISSVTLTSAGTVNTANAGAYAIAVTPGSEVFSVGSTSNYTITYADGVLTVNPATLTYTANAAGRQYGATDPAFSGSVTGFVLGQSLATATTGSASFITNAVNTSNVGSYSITGSGLTANNGNYVFTQAAGNSTAFSITARPIDVTANAISRVYGDADPALTYAVGGMGLATWDTNATAFTGALSRAAGENVAASPYAISQGTLTATNYTITFAGNIFTITPAPLSVYAFPTNKIISTPDPLLTYMVSGLKLGDTAAATLNAGSLARDAGEAVGNYQINLGSLALASSNYTMNYFPASFTVLAPTVVDEIANAILLLGTPDTGSAQSTSSSDEEEKRKAEEEVATPETPASGDTAAQPLPVCPGA